MSIEHVINTLHCIQWDRVGLILKKKNSCKVVQINSQSLHSYTKGITWCWRAMDSSHWSQIDLTQLLSCNTALIFLYLVWFSCVWRFISKRPWHWSVVSRCTGSVTRDQRVLAWTGGRGAGSYNLTVGVTYILCPWISPRGSVDKDKLKCTRWMHWFS